MKRIHIYFLGAIFLLMGSCKKDLWNLKQEDFAQLAKPVIQKTDAIDSIKISSELLDLEVQNADQHGFIAFEGLPLDATDRPSLGVFDLGPFNQGSVDKTQEGPFEATIKVVPNTLYTFVAYAVVGEKEFYSDTTSFISCSGRVETLPFVYYGGHEMVLRGQLRDTEKGILAEEHGFCWSTTNPVPNIDEDDFFDIGVLTKNDSFTLEFGGLPNEVPINFRAYAIIELFNEFGGADLDTVYGEVVNFDGNLNFWVYKDNSFIDPAVALATGFTLGDKAYLGTGKGDNGFTDAFWEFSPVDSLWRTIDPFPGGAITSAIGFSIESTGKGYVGMGFDGNFDIPDFYSYSPSTGWTKLEDFSGPRRSDGVGFSIGNKGYFGLGYDGFDVFDDMWEFDPAKGVSGEWRRIAPLPGSPRSDAVSFVIDGIAYVGGGRGLGADDEFSDFWAFDPGPAGSQGSWSNVADMQDSRTGKKLFRQRGIAFTLENKGYVGTGRGNNNLHADFYMYDPTQGDKGTWIPKSEFPDGPIYQSVGFAMNGKGYLVTGFDGFGNTGEMLEFDP